MSKQITIFGASGFLGERLTEKLYNEGHWIRAVARNEGNLVALKEKFPRIEILVGDIADVWTVKKAMEEAEECYLLAAMKHVGLAEKDVRSCVNSNIVGAMNVIYESFLTRPDLLMFVSTDKAAQPNGVYGCSKKIIEKMMVEAEGINKGTTYRTVRYGNVLYSTGSVLCKWKDKMQRGEEVIVTEPEATRFFFTIDQAIQLIFECKSFSGSAEPYVKRMKSIRIGDLLEAMMDKYGRVPVKKIGLQPAENLHEIIIPEWPDSSQSEKYTKEEILEFI